MSGQASQQSHVILHFAAHPQCAVSERRASERTPRRHPPGRESPGERLGAVRVRACRSDLQDRV